MKNILYGAVFLSLISLVVYGFYSLMALFFNVDPTAALAIGFLGFIALNVLYFIGYVVRCNIEKNYW